MVNLKKVKKKRNVQSIHRSSRMRCFPARGPDNRFLLLLVLFCYLTIESPLCSLTSVFYTLVLEKRASLLRGYILFLFCYLNFLISVHQQIVTFLIVT